MSSWKTAATLLLVYTGLEALAGSIPGQDHPPLWLRAEGPLSLIALILLAAWGLKKCQSIRRPWSVLLPIAVSATLLLPLFPFCRPPASPYSVHVSKAQRQIELSRGSEVIDRFPVALGGNPLGPKRREGDLRTPEGDYFVCSRGPSQYRKWLGVSYPSPREAITGRWSGRISWIQFWLICVQNANARTPLQETDLGGAVGIHGGGIRHDWTLGCIALRNEDIDRLYALVPIGTPVRIDP